MTVRSVEVLSSIAAVNGGAISPPAGGQLVLFSSTYANSRSQERSCGDTGPYIQVFDDQGREMTQVFETYRIAGNPGCNEYRLQDTPHAWNLAFQSVSGAAPVAMSSTDTGDLNSTVWLDLRT